MASPDIDHLFSVPLQTFIAERKRMAQALRDAGRGDDAKTIEKIPRPTVPAWAVNQVARSDPKLVSRLAELTAELQGAQGRISAGGGGGQEYGAAAVEHRQVLGALRVKAEEVLAGQGHPPSPQVLRRVLTNLRAGVASPDTRALVEAGRLSRDVEEKDFTTLFEQAAPPRQPATRVQKARNDRAPGQGSEVRDGAARGKRAELPKSATAGKAAKAAEAREATRQRRQHEADVRAEKRQLDRERNAAERRVAELRAASSAARAALEKQQRTSAAARQALAAAEKQVEIARTKTEEVARDLAAAEAELARLRPP